MLVGEAGPNGGVPGGEESAMSVKVHVAFPCQEGRGSELVEFMRTAALGARNAPGNEGIEVFTDADDPDMVIHLQTWADRAAREAYIATLVESGAMGQVSAFLAGPLQSTYLDPTDI